jgi:hypothetical protein
VLHKETHKEKIGVSQHGICKTMHSVINKVSRVLFPGDDIVRTKE